MITSSFEKKLLGGLGLASIIIAGVTIVYHFSTTRLLASAERANQSHQFVLALSDLARAVQTARMTTRGYVITGDVDIYNLHERATADVESGLAAMRNAAAGDQHRLNHVHQLEKLAEPSLQENERLLELREKAGGLIAGLSAGLNYRIDVDDPLRQVIEHVTTETREELVTRERLAQVGRTALLSMLLFGAIVELAFAVAAAGVIRRHMRERQRATEELRRSELTLRNFYDSGVTVMGIAGLTENRSDFQIVSANAATAALFGVELSKLIGRRASELGSAPETIKLFLEHFARSQSEGRPVHFQYERVTLHGVRSFTTVICAIPSDSPQPRFSFVLLDETERKQAERALQRHAAELASAKDALEKQSEALQEARRAADAASEAKSNFLANMSHEIRTPMTAVVGYAELLGDTTHTDTQRQEWSQIIRRNASHLLDLLNDILDVSKIEAGKMTPQIGPCDIAQVIGDVVEMMRQRAAEKGLALRLEIDEPIIRDVETDALRVRQVVVNLIGNAIKFTEAGEVAAHLSCDGTSLGINVRDSGIGMNAEQVARIFRPFTQADETTTRRFGGTGLGLTISKRLVEMLGGEIAVRSEPGLGSTFSVSVPIKPAAEPVAKPNASAAAGPMRGRILVAEDAVDMQRLISLLLTRAGAEVIVAANGVQAVEMATSQPFDLILMDMQMSHLDGHGAATELRRRGIRTPIIALTANAMTGDRERCLAAGCDDYLTKPLDRVVLLARVQDYLQGSRTSAASAKVA